MNESLSGAVVSSMVVVRKWTQLAGAEENLLSRDVSSCRGVLIKGQAWCWG